MIALSLTRSATYLYQMRLAQTVSAVVGASKCKSATQVAASSQSCDDGCVPEKSHWRQSSQEVEEQSFVLGLTVLWLCTCQNPLHWSRQIFKKSVGNPAYICGDYRKFVCKRENVFGQASYIGTLTWTSSCSNEECRCVCVCAKLRCCLIFAKF